MEGTCYIAAQVPTLEIAYGHPNFRVPGYLKTTGSREIEIERARPQKLKTCQANFRVPKETARQYGSRRVTQVPSRT